MSAAQSILDMTRAFMEPAFDRSAAEAMLGPVTRGEDPGTLVIQPRDTFLERVTLETAQSGPDMLLTMVYLKYATPVDVDLRVIVNAFGSPNELPRLKPDQPTPLVFTVPSPDFDGTLMLQVARTPGDVRSTEAIRLTRFRKAGGQETPVG